MTSYNPPVKGAQYIFYISLRDQSNTKVFKSNPTIASGDFKVSIDGGALANPATLPAVTPASSKMVKVTLSTSEMNGDNITFIASDASGSEWCDLAVNIQTVASGHQFDNMLGNDSTTEITAKKVTISNSAGDAVVITSTGSNGDGIQATGHGTGQGINATGGTSGAGLSATGNGAQPGLHAIGAGTGAGILAVATSNNHGISGNGVGSGKAGLHAGATSNAHGVLAVGHGTGVDVSGDITGNLTGNVVGDLTGTADANLVEINGNTSLVTVFQKLMTGTIQFTATAAGSSTTAIVTNLTEVTNDHYKQKLVLWITGAMLGQVREVTAYNGTTKVLTVGAMTDTPADGDLGVLI